MRSPVTMCNALDRPAAPRTRPRPRWGVLYTLAALPLAALAGVESAGAPSAIYTLLETGLAVIAFAGMLAWTWCNRAALEADTGCECADSTVRVSAVGAPAVGGVSRRPAVPAASPVGHDDESRELVGVGSPIER
jgi:hypothetical protein